jgi:hypothetical protein
VKIRIMGTEAECRDVPALLPAIVDVLSADGPRPSRNSPRLMFLYIEARPAHPGTLLPGLQHITATARPARPGRRALPPGGDR